MTKQHPDALCAACAEEEIARAADCLRRFSAAKAARGMGAMPPGGREQILESENAALRQTLAHHEARAEKAESRAEELQLIVDICANCHTPMVLDSLNQDDRIAELEEALGTALSEIPVGMTWTRLEMIRVNAKAKRARLDADGTAKPKTEIVEVFDRDPEGKLQTCFDGQGKEYVVKETPTSRDGWLTRMWEELQKGQLGGLLDDARKEARAEAIEECAKALYGYEAQLVVGHGSDDACGTAFNCVEIVRRLTGAK